MKVVLLTLLAAYARASPFILQTEPSYLGFEYDYSADLLKQEAVLAEATTQPPVQEPRDPLAEAREMARLNIMDRILIALGPPFGEKLPKAPTSNTLATVQTPINITTEPCPYKYKRCSSQTYFPSCDIPRNTAPEIWPQRFNLFFNLSADFNNKLDVINATLRLYKNNSLPLERAKTVLISAYGYTRSLTRRRNKYKLVADTQVSSDYLGWVTLSVTELVKRWKRQKNNHGVLITVNDVDDTPWDAPRIFVTMDCTSGLPPLPFEVQMEEVSQQYPALNIRLGSPDQEQDAPFGTSFASRPQIIPTVPVNTTPEPTPTMQGDDPLPIYEYNYESDLNLEEAREVEEEELGEVEDSIIRVENDGTPQDSLSHRPFHPLHNLYIPALHGAPQDSSTETPTPQSLTTHPPTTYIPTTMPTTTTTASPSPKPRRGPSRRRGGSRHRKNHRGGHRN